MALLVAVDFSQSTQRVIDQAERLGKRFSEKVWLLHVAHPDPLFVGYGVGPQAERDAIAKVFHDEHCELQMFAEKLRNAGMDCSALLVQGPTIETILKEAKKLSVQLIVVGSHGKGNVEKFLVGSTSGGVLRGSSVPVLVVPTHSRV